MLGKTASRLLPLVAALCMLGASPAGAQRVTDDVPLDHWAYDALEYLLSLGVIAATDDGPLRWTPEDGVLLMTRGKFARVITAAVEYVRWNRDECPGGYYDHVPAMVNDLQREFLAPEDVDPLWFTGTSAWDEVATDHWAYAVLEWFCEEGILEGYPEGFFNGERVLTRYEFAQAIARLVGTLDNGTYEEPLMLLSEVLMREFSDQFCGWP